MEKNRRKIRLERIFFLQLWKFTQKYRKHCIFCKNTKRKEWVKNNTETKNAYECEIETKKNHSLTSKNQMIIEVELDIHSFHKLVRKITKQLSFLAAFMEFSKKMGEVSAYWRYDSWDIWFNLMFWSCSSVLLLWSFNWDKIYKVFLLA